MGHTFGNLKLSDMKRMSFLLFVLVPLLVFAQSEKEEQRAYDVYCEMSIALGNHVIIGDYEQNIIVDENGKEIKFTLPVRALSYMAKRGWEFVSFLDTTNYNILLKKSILRDEQALEGLKFKKEPTLK